MSIDPIIAILSEDSELITYRKSLRKITKTVTGTILLQQMMFRSKDRDKFYKFKSPCVHKLYKKGDSWEEELGFSIKEFDNALKKIGTKITQGVSKKDALKKTDPTGIVLYWTDASRVTWYQINRDLLGKLLVGIYLKDNQRALTKKPPKGDIPLTETTTETTTNISPSGEKSPSVSNSTNTPQRDTLQDEPPALSSEPVLNTNPVMGDLWEDAAEGKVEVATAYGEASIPEKTACLIYRCSLDNSSVEQIAKKVSLPVELVNDIIRESGYPPPTDFDFYASLGPPTAPDLTDILTELAEDEALADDFTDLTTPRTNAKLLSEADAAHLRTFGKFSGSELPGIYDIIQEIKAVWEIKDPTEELAIALFLEAIRTKRPAFAIPKNQGIRNDWVKSVRGHLQDYPVVDLGGLYQLAITKLDLAGMTFSRPGSLTKTLPDVVDEPTAKTIVDEDGGFYI